MQSLQESKLGRGMSFVVHRAAVIKALLCVLLFAVCVPVWAQSSWVQIGPEGGDVRALAFDPRNPDHILLGTSAGQLYQSRNAGASWSRFRHFGTGDDYVLDNIAFDPKDPKTIYVAAWSVEAESNGDLFRSRDGGHSWQLIPYMRGKSIRAMALADSDPRIVTVGALDGVFRSTDSGDTWVRISPEGHAEIKNIESIAVDPKNPQVVYAGTWHLPWKTEDGGKTWHNIKKGVIDDSDVFSIIIDHNNPSVVFASACSGIYKSESAGELFHKITGIPATARRTRVLQQDPANSNVVYAGTTEGLWKSLDAGKTFSRITPGNYIINDVMVDPRNPNRVLIATDRSGVLASNDGMKTFAASNTGFSHRQVSTVVVDGKDSSTVYAGVLNDKDFGGVFVTHNSGVNWAQQSEGLAGRDVFSIVQTSEGSLLAGTNRGIFKFDPTGRQWRPASTVLTEKKIAAIKARKVKGKLIAGKPSKSEWIRSELNIRVTQMQSAGGLVFASTTNGFYRSRDEGKSWMGGPIAAQSYFIAISASGSTVAVATPKAVMVSTDSGETWAPADIPGWVNRIYRVTIAPDNSLWLTSREGALRSTDNGKHWDHVMSGLPPHDVFNIEVDRKGNRLLATAMGTDAVYESRNEGRTWTVATASGFNLRGAINFNGHLLAATAFNGLVMQQGSDTERAAVNQATPGGQN